MTRVTIILQYRGCDRYRVLEVHNSLSPRPGEYLDKKEVEKLVREGLDSPIGPCVKIKGVK